MQTNECRAAKYGLYRFEYRSILAWKNCYPSALEKIMLDRSSGIESLPVYLEGITESIGEYEIKIL